MIFSILVIPIVHEIVINLAQMFSCINLMTRPFKFGIAEKHDLEG